MFILRIAIFCLFILPSFTQAQEQTKKIKIGVSSALTGQAAAYGLDIKDAVSFAAEHLGMDNFEFFFEDDRCNGKDAATIANKFVNVLDVDFVVGYACSSTLLAAAPIYEKAKVPVIVTCASSARIADAGDYIFRTTPSDRFAATRLYRHVKDKHKVLGLISEEDEYPQALQKAFVDANSDGAMKLVIENYLPKTEDFRTQILKLKKQKVEGLFLITQSEAASVSLLKQVRELKWDVPIYGAYWPSSPSYLELAGSFSEGIEFVDTPPLSSMLKSEGEKIFEDFLKKYPKIRSIESVWATTFEGLRIVKQASESKKEVRDYLYNSKFKGIFGEYHFDKNGEIQGLDFAMKRVEDGAPILIE